MSQFALESFGGYQKARQLFDFVVGDMGELRKDPRCYRLVAQQVGSADSVCANIEEGYGRLSRAEYLRFPDFARGSARETRGRYERMKPWLEERVIQHRVGLADEIIGILTSTIATLQADLQRDRSRTSYLRDEPVSAYSEADAPSLPFDALPSPLDTPPSSPS
jgi:four helix bundle protein